MTQLGIVEERRGKPYDFGDVDGGSTYSFRARRETGHESQASRKVYYESSAAYPEDRGKRIDAAVANGGNRWLPDADASSAITHHFVAGPGELYLVHLDDETDYACHRHKCY